MKKKELKNALKVMKIVFRQPAYVILAFGIATGIMIFSIWLPNLGFVANVIKSSTYALSAKFDILISSLGAFGTNFTLETQIITIAVAVLTGINVAVFIYYLKKRSSIEKSMGTSTLGTFIGLLGVGCASCGSVVLSSVFGLTATAGFIGFFPLKGAEFGLLGISLLLFSTWTLLKKIKDPLLCKI